jgi:IS30 family transposase
MTETKKRTVTTKELQTMQYLTKRGYSNVKIGALMGFNESTVRRALKSTQKTETV